MKTTTEQQALPASGLCKVDPKHGMAMHYGVCKGCYFSGMNSHGGAGPKVRAVWTRLSGLEYPVPRVNGARGAGRRREQKRPEPVGAVRETDAAWHIDGVQALRAELADERIAVCLELAIGLGLERIRYAGGWILSLPAPLATRRVLLTPGGRLRPVGDIEAVLGEPITAKEKP